RQTLRFGIDFVGGTYLTLEVKTNKAVEADLIGRMQNIETKFKRNRAISLISKKIENNSLILVFENTQQAQEAAHILKSDERDLRQDVNKNSIILTLPSQLEQRIKDDAVLRNIEVLRTRLDRFSV